MTFNMSFQAAARDAQKKYLERLHQVDWAVIIEQAPFSFFFFLFCFSFFVFPFLFGASSSWLGCHHWTGVFFFFFYFYLHFRRHLLSRPHLLFCFDWAVVIEETSFHYAWSLNRPLFIIFGASSIEQDRVGLKVVNFTHTQNKSKNVNLQKRKFDFTYNKPDDSVGLILNLVSVQQARPSCIYLYFIYRYIDTFWKVEYISYTQKSKRKCGFSTTSKAFFALLF